MNIGIKKAFSLTELLIVIVVIALLFAAMAPIITKRHISETSATEYIWNIVSNDSEMNSYFDPGAENWTSSLYVGYTPISKNDKAGKLVINSKNITYSNSSGVSSEYKQPQMQFRFSTGTQQQGRGLNSANLLLDASNNVFFGSDPSKILSGSKNTVYGLSNLPGITHLNGITAIGAYALGDAQFPQSNSYNNNFIALGHRAAYHLGTIESPKISNIFAGSGAGSGSSKVMAAPNDNIAIGSQTISEEGYLGSSNIFIGAMTGNGFKNNSARNNIIIGSNFHGNNASGNTIVGYGTYNKGNKNVKNMTAIGYGACGSIAETTNDTRVVCLGYNSAQSAHNSPSSVMSDGGEHIFIGGTPRDDNSSGAFSGRSVLEVHNNGNDGNVILNSNLVVRGNFYPSDNGKVKYNTFASTLDLGAENQYYRCNKDSFKSVLSLKGFVCTEMAKANPKSINALKQQDDCPNSDGYPSGGSKCPNLISSDIRLKTNITPNNDGLNKLQQLFPYNYTYISDMNKTPQVGVIAQDLQKVFPNSVSKDDKGFLKIRWDEMFYALINSIKELSAKIDDVSNKISQITNDISNISNKQKKIKKEISELNTRLNRLEKEQ